MIQGTVIYVHGFGSVGEGPKTDALRAALPGIKVIAPNLPVDPNKVERILDDVLRNDAILPVVMVGTSLGGFWSDYMAKKWLLECVIVNPAVEPSKTMALRKGQLLVNYVTGESIRITDDDVAEFKRREDLLADNTSYNAEMVDLFVAADDNILDHTAALAKYSNAKSITVTEDGGHRYESHWSDVCEFIRREHFSETSRLQNKYYK